MLSTKKTRNFTEGPLFFRILLFSLPIMITGVLQLLYNMADNIVVGQFSGDPNALGAVGSTSSLTNLILNLLLGTSAGTGVVVAQCIGAKRDRDVSRAVHTAMIFSFFAGVAFGLIGLIISRPVLDMIGPQKRLLDQAVLYMRIICCGIPASAVYNFGAAILRSAGDSKTPLVILTTTGLVNVILNLVFVISCGMSVAGVALATIISQYLSAIAVVIVLMKKEGEAYQFSFKKLCFDRSLLRRILRIGIPSGIQGSLFSIANIILTNGINSFGDPNIITAYTITNNIDGITYTACNSFYQAVLTVTGQNYGAMKHERIKKTLLYALIQVTLVGIIISQLILIFSDFFVGLYVAADAPNKAEVTKHAIDMMRLFLNVYFLCGIMEVIVGVLRGLAYSITPMIMSLVGVCVLRTLWRYFIFPLETFNTPVGLLLCFPISWIATILMQLSLFIYAWHKLKERFASKKAEEAEKETQSVG